MAGSWCRLLQSALREEELERLRERERTGRALGNEEFSERRHETLGRALQR